MKILIFSILDKTIKLWKIGEKKINQIIRSNTISNNLNLNIPKLKQEEPILRATPRRIYSNAHAYHVNSISLNSDGETFISADDLRINWWHTEINDKCFSKLLLFLHLDYIFKLYIYV